MFILLDWFYCSWGVQKADHGEVHIEMKPITQSDYKVGIGFNRVAQPPPTPEKNKQQDLKPKYSNNCTLTQS